MYVTIVVINFLSLAENTSVDGAAHGGNINKMFFKWIKRRIFGWGLIGAYLLLKPRLDTVNIMIYLIFKP